MAKLALLVPPLSGEGIYRQGSLQRRPFDFVTVNLLVAVLSRRYEVELLDLDLEGKLTTGEYEVALRQAALLVVYITQGHPHRLIDRYVRSAACPVVIVGPGSANYDNPDCLSVVGEPEFEIEVLIDEREARSPSHSRTRRRVQSFGDLDSLPMADHRNLAKLTARGGYPSVLVSRGCNNSCVFCRSNDFYVPGKKKHRTRAVAHITDEIAVLKKMGASVLHLECESLVPDEPNGYTRLLLERLRGQGISYSTFCNVKPLKSIEFVRELYSSGCRCVFIGVESSNDDVLLRWRKPHRRQDVEAALQNLNGVGIQYGVGFMPFNPYTTRASLLSDLFFLKKIVEGAFSHPLNICCFVNRCAMGAAYSLELSVWNLWMRFKQIHDELVLPEAVRLETEASIYPERIAPRACRIDHRGLLEHLLSLCEEKMVMGNIEVRQVTQDDAVFLQQLMNDDQIIEILHEVPTSVAVWADAIAEWNSDPDEEDYIILEEGMPVGWLGVNGLLSKRKEAFIKVVALLPTHQGREIGQYVIKEMIENLRLRGFVSLELYTDLSNVRAQRCYGRCGFAVSGKTVQRMSDGTVVDRCKMALSL